MINTVENVIGSNWLNSGGDSVVYVVFNGVQVLFNGEPVIYTALSDSGLPANAVVFNSDSVEHNSDTVIHN